MALEPEESQTAPEAMPSGHNDAQRNLGEIRQCARTIRSDRRTSVQHQSHANMGGRGADPPPNNVQQNGRNTQPHWPSLAGDIVRNALRRVICQTHKSGRLRREDQRRCHGRLPCAHGSSTQIKVHRLHYLRNVAARYGAVYRHRHHRRMGAGTPRHGDFIYGHHAKGVDHPPPSGVHRLSCPRPSGAA